MNQRSPAVQRYLAGPQYSPAVQRYLAAPAPQQQANVMNNRRFLTRHDLQLPPAPAPAPALALAPAHRPPPPRHGQPAPHPPPPHQGHPVPPPRPFARLNIPDIPEGSTTVIGFDNIVQGTPMVDWGTHYRHGKLFTLNEFNNIHQEYRDYGTGEVFKIDPLTRERISRNNLRHYNANLVRNYVPMIGGR